MMDRHRPTWPDMAAYIKAKGLSFCMASARRYAEAMTAAGFGDVTTSSRNSWYLHQAGTELARLEDGPLHDRAVAAVRQAHVARNIRTWAAMLQVPATGEHCPTNLRARKPG